MHNNHVNGDMLSIMLCEFAQWESLKLPLLCARQRQAEQFRATHG